MIAGAGGEALSKRLGSLSLASLRASGLEAMTVNGYLARLGPPAPIAPPPDLAALAARFDLAGGGPPTPKFDPGELDMLNAGLPHAPPFETVDRHLRARSGPAPRAGVRDNPTTR